MKLKPVFRFDSSQCKLRLFRLLWSRGQLGHGGYSAKLSVSLVPKLIGLRLSIFGWRFTIAGIQLHHLRAYGGTIV